MDTSEKFSYVNLLRSEESGTEISSIACENNNTSTTTRERWNKGQTASLVEAWKENYNDLLTCKQATAWLKIQSKVNEYGSTKSTKQIKTKIKNLKDSYKNAKENNKKSGASPQYSPFYHDFDDILGTRDCLVLPDLKEIGSADVTYESEDDAMPNSPLIFPLPSHSMSENAKSDEPFASSSGIENKKGVPKRGKGKNSDNNNYLEELIAVQTKEIRRQQERDIEHQQFLSNLLGQQQTIEREEREKYREFFTNLANLFAGKNN